MLEMDCHITKDGMVVISHDSTLLRTTGHSVSILETDYKDLPRLKERLRPSFAQDHETVGGEDRQIPLLRDIFIKFPDTPINIDIKIDDDELIQKVGELVAEFGREPITVWGSRSMAVINKCYATNPAIPVFFCIQRVVALLLLYYSGLLPFVPLRESFYEVLMPSIALRQGKMAMTLNTRYRLLVRLADCLMMRKSLIKHLTDRGVQVYLWVLNEEEDWHRAFQLGASGVMTDFPTRLSRFLEAHPHYMSRPEP